MQTQVLQSNYRYTAGQCWKRNPLNDDLMPLENIKFGYGVVRSQSQSNSCRLPNMNSYVGVLDGDLVSGGTVSLVGYTEAPDGTQDAFSIAVTYASSHAATAAAIKAAIEAAASDVICTLSNSNRTFTVVAGADKKLVITTPFTRGGSGSTSFTNTKGTTDSIRGIASRDPNAPTVLDYSYTEPYHKAKHKLIGVTFQGDPAVPVTGTPAAGGSVYCLLEDYTDTNTVLNPRGSFRTDTDSGAAPVVLVSDTEFADEKDNGLAPLSMNKV